MQPPRFSLVLLVLLAGLTTPAGAGQRACIIVGLAAGETQAARLQSQAHILREGFLARGFSADAITVLGARNERVRRDAVLAALQPPIVPGPSANTAANTAADTAAGDDETWIVLLGSASTRGGATTAAGDTNDTSNASNPGVGEPRFQIAGPRLSATDLAAAVRAIPGRRFVVIATSASGGFLPPLLALPEVEAVAATADAGEVNEPRFAEAWAEALVAAPHASFGELAATAAARVATFYEDASLAQSEHARLIDRATGRIVEAPFAPVEGAMSGSPAPSPTGPSASPAQPSPPISVADITIPKPSTDTEIERRPATDETRALLAEARAAAEGIEHAALLLRIDTEITVGGDFAVTERHRTRAFLRTGEALDDLGTLLLPSDPPHLVTRLEAVRILAPDGAQILVNPRAFDERLAADRREADDARAKGRPVGPPAPPLLPLPGVTAGCVVETAWTVERGSSLQLPEFSETWSLAKRYPVRLLHLSVTTPADKRWRVFAPNLPAPLEWRSGGNPAADGSNPSGKIAAAPTAVRATTWTLADVPAFEPRFGDAPAARFAPWVGVSSLASWEAFAAWYRRIASDSAQTGPAVAALAAEIAAAHPDRASRLRAASDRVSSLRYVAIELGVGAFRPRTPEDVWTRRYGDCKDKANLLVALLAKLGIPAEFALVNRFGHTFTDWPAWQFNHALVRVPAAPEAGQPHDLWLDTTDRLVPFGIVAPGDLGRHALSFSRDFSTAAFHEITALQEPASVWHETLTPPQGKTLRLRLSASGAAGVSLRRLFVNLSPAERRERLQSMYPGVQYTITSVEIGDPFDLAADFVVNASATLNREGPPAPLSPPGLAAFFASETITRPVQWDEGRGARLMCVSPTLPPRELIIPAGPLSPETYADLRARWLTFSR